MDLKKLPKTEFAAAVAQIAGERDIDVQSILDSIELGLISAYKRDQKERGVEVAETTEFTVELAPETGAFKVYELKDSGRKVDVTPPGFGRIAAQTAKQVIDQKIFEAEKEKIIADYVQKVGTLITGTVLRVDPYKITVGVGKTEGLVPRDEQVRGENFMLGGKKLFLLKDIAVNPETTKKEIILSRKDNEFIRQLFIREVPEVANRSVKIEKIARAAGERTKVAVSSSQSGVDPVGSCIGQKGSRIQSILNELPPGEKIDVVLFSKNQPLFVVNALSPAQNVTVESIKNGVATVLVPEDQLALAIGAGGENVKLAGLLVGLEIKVTSAAEAAPAAA
ncbi:transcription termination factor NusA [Patescibacteria group bacterium]|nr:transcription termination factor NusA [Patescibacteria group bacterium]